MTTDATTAWEALTMAHTAMTRELTDLLDLSPTGLREYEVMNVLSRVGEEGMRLNRLNEHIPLTQSSLSRMTERLVARGLVKSWQDPQDLRGTRFRLTSAGVTKHAIIASHHHRIIRANMEAALTPEEILTLTSIARKITPQEAR